MVFYVNVIILFHTIRCDIKSKISCWLDIELHVVYSRSKIKGYVSVRFKHIYDMV